MKNKLIKVLALVTFFSMTSSVYCEAASTWDDVDFPQWSKDIRRTEIITLGSLPFVTLWTSLGYGLAVKGTFHNPLDKSTSGYTQEDQKKIIGIAAAASIGLGLTDLTINLITRNAKMRKNKKNQQKSILVVPLSQEIMEQVIPETIELPEENDQEINENLIEDITVITDQENKFYFVKGMESAIF